MGRIVRNTGVGSNHPPAHRIGLADLIPATFCCLYIVTLLIHHETCFPAARQKQDVGKPGSCSSSLNTC